MKKYAVVLMNLGGPNSLETVQTFLENLFNDPDIFKIPIFQKSIAKLIAKKRAPKVVEEYRLIGGKSPIGEWTELQRSMLEKSLNKDEELFDVFIAMRYFKPYTHETIKKVQEQNYEKIILFPLYPQYSFSTTKSSFNEWERYYKGDKSKLIRINNFYQNKLYLKAINQRIDEALSKFSDPQSFYFLFSAHGIPLSYVKKGDPYQKQIEETMKLVMEIRNYSNPYSLAYQSKVGPMKWLEPATDKEIRRLGESGVRNLLVIPISFVSDHIETLYELDIEYRKVAQESGVENYIVMRGLNDSELFIESIKEEIWKMLS